MTQHSDHNTSNIGEAILAENAEHEGRPRAMSAARAQESWEEFKQRSNKMAEAVLAEVTNPKAMRTRARQMGRKAKAYYSEYQTYVFIAAGIVAAVGLTAALMPLFKKKRSLLKI